jgi:hypothetical protein
MTYQFVCHSATFFLLAQFVVDNVAYERWVGVITRHCDLLYVNG